MNYLYVMIVVAGLAIAPFVLMLTSSFVKFSVVFSIVRSAVGSQQIPPNPVIIGLAVALTIHVMTPVVLEMRKGLEDQPLDLRGIESGHVDLKALVDPFRKASEPLKRFLLFHAHPIDTQMFESFAARAAARDLREIASCSFDVLIPAFVVSELKEAFEIGFLIFLPFLIVDMIVANILQAMGMMMLSPTTISLPFKLLLFVVSDGWHLIVESLLRGYFTA